MLSVLAPSNFIVRSIPSDSDNFMSALPPPKDTEFIVRGTLIPFAIVFLSSLFGRGGCVACLSLRLWRSFLALTGGEPLVSRFSPASTITWFLMSAKIEGSVICVANCCWGCPFASSTLLAKTELFKLLLWCVLFYVPCKSCFVLLLCLSDLSVTALLVSFKLFVFPSYILFYFWNRWSPLPALDP